MEGKDKSVDLTGKAEKMEPQKRPRGRWISTECCREQACSRGISAKRKKKNPNRRQ